MPVHADPTTLATSRLTWKSSFGSTLIAFAIGRLSAITGLKMLGPAVRTPWPPAPAAATPPRTPDSSLRVSSLLISRSLTIRVVITVLLIRGWLDSREHPARRTPTAQVVPHSRGRPTET